MKNDTQKLINELIESLPGYVPVESEPKNLAEQGQGLAESFMNKGFRSYLEKMIRSQITGMVAVEDLNGLFFQKGRILALKELHRAMQQAYTDFEKIRKIELKDN